MKKNAFTLVELSIVLLIIGLIIGGITAGSSLIKQASLKAVIAEVNGFNTAINAFRIQYNFLPGDFNLASQFWIGVQNGNGNGTIEIGVPNNTTQDENTLAWQHMTMAGVLPGSYNGVNSPAGQGIQGVNIPPSKYKSNAGYFFDNTNCFNRNYITLGAYNVNNMPFNTLLVTLDLYNIDKKMDDGAPGTGKIIAPWWDAANSYTTCTFPANGGSLSPCALAATSSYNVTVTGPNCIAYFVFR
jgi:prepilin-type N-terminal cleavage/methylation domain-containing protein